MDTGPAVMDLSVVCTWAIRVRDAVIPTVLIRRAPFLKKIGTTIQRIKTGVKGEITILDIFFSMLTERADFPFRFSGIHGMMGNSKKNE